MTRSTSGIAGAVDSMGDSTQADRERSRTKQKWAPCAICGIPIKQSMKRRYCKPCSYEALERRRKKKTKRYQEQMAREQGQGSEDDDKR